MTTLMMLFVFCHRGRSEHYWKSDWHIHKAPNLHRQFAIAFVFAFVRSCKMSQIWQIYLCKNMRRLGVNSEGDQRVL